VQTPDGATTTLTYNSTTNNLQTISEPGSRSLSITINSSSGNLTGITDVDTTTRTLGYDSNHHLTSDQWSPLNASFTFASTGLLTQVNRGLGTSYMITSAASIGLSTASIIGSGTALDKKKGSGVFVRRAKAYVFSGCDSHPATFAPAGSNRSDDGGNEIVEAFDAKCRLAVPRVGRP